MISESLANPTGVSPFWRVYNGCVFRHCGEGLRNVFRDAATSTFTAQVGSQWHKEAMSNGKCNKPWLLSPRMEGGREGEGSRGGKKWGKRRERARERKRKRRWERPCCSYRKKLQNASETKRNTRFWNVTFGDEWVWHQGKGPSQVYTQTFSFSVISEWRTSAHQLRLHLHSATSHPKKCTPARPELERQSNFTLCPSATPDAHSTFNPCPPKKGKKINIWKIPFGFMKRLMECIKLFKARWLKKTQQCLWQAEAKSPEIILCRAALFFLRSFFVILLKTWTVS